MDLISFLWALVLVAVFVLAVVVIFSLVLVFRLAKLMKKQAMEAAEWRNKTLEMQEKILEEIKGLKD